MEGSHAEMPKRLLAKSEREQANPHQFAVDHDAIGFDLHAIPPFRSLLLI